MISLHTDATLRQKPQQAEGDVLVHAFRYLFPIAYCGLCRCQLSLTK